MNKTIDQYTAEARAQLPGPGDDPLQGLRHTLAAFAESADDDFAILATSGVYRRDGQDVKTGITWGDLRQILDWLEKSEEHLAPRHPVFGRE